MNKKLFLFLSLFLVISVYIFDIDRIVQNKISSLSATVSKTYLEIGDYIDNAINKYILRTKYIEQLQKENEKYKQLYGKKLKEEKDSKKYSSKIATAKILKYYQLNSFSKVLLTLKDNNTTVNKSIQGLVSYDGYSMGIVIKKDNINIGYLNPNEKCNYAVYIGKQKSTGITAGYTIDGLLKIKYIPLWHDVKISDEVITSSMDGIFPVGVKVGKVVKVFSGQITKEVLVKPYSNPYKYKQFYVY